MAREKMAAYAETVKAKGLVSGSRKVEVIGERGFTVSQYVDAVFRRHEARGLRRQDNERARIKNHVEPVLAARGVEHFTGITQMDCRAIVEDLDEKVNRGELGGATARCTWHLWRLLCRESCASKIDQLRIREDNPASEVLPPEKTAQKARQWLYPEELAALLWCEAVPIRWRRLYALGVYLCLRAGEIGALDVAPVDLERGRVRVDKAVQRDDGQIGTTKTKDTREFEVPATIRPLLAAMVKEAGEGGLLAPLPPFEDLAETFRVHVRRAGMTRPELFAATKTSIPVKLN